MSEKSEIVFMQVRLLRLASEEWHTTIQKVSRLFEKYGILKFIEDCYGVFHTEGDEAVFDEINVVLDHNHFLDVLYLLPLCHRLYPPPDYLHRWCYLYPAL